MKNAVSSIKCLERWFQVNTGSATVPDRDVSRSDAERETRSTIWSAWVLSKMLDIPFGFRPKIVLAGIRTWTPANPTGETRYRFSFSFSCFKLSIRS